MNKPPEKSRGPLEEEIAKRRDAGLRRLLKMPPKPHAEVAGKGKRKPETKKGGSPKK